MRRLICLVMLTQVFSVGCAIEAGGFEFDKEYLYSRDAIVPPFQKSREFFDMPNRPGNYEVIMVSENVGPLTFRMVRARGEQEKTLVQRRSYRAGNHEFEAYFNNLSGNDDLIVEIANSNPVASATVSVFVVEVPAH
ncbi:MAG: hypothetical protein Q9M08_05910 [Mariprofundus sp.]|nr:hypothetical protein [Mariprofundus sp.]